MSITHIKPATAWGLLVGFAVFALAMAMSGFTPAHATVVGKVTICHADGDGTFQTLHVSANATGGHFENGGTPLQGHEDDLLFDGEVECPNDEEEEEDDSVTIVAYKLVCTDEADVPNPENWGDLDPIGASTASDWEAQHESCDFASDWEFQWVLDSENTDPGDTFVGPAGDPWTTFGPTNENGMTSVVLTADDLEGESRIWLREVLQDNYIPFTHEESSNEDEYSAGFYCNNDVLNLDNLEWIAGIKSGATYYCVAWNVPEKGSLTVQKEVSKDYQGEWLFHFTGMDEAGFDLTNVEPSKTWEELTVGEYTINEIVPEGWALEGVFCDDKNSGEEQEEQEKDDLVVVLDPGEEVTCTFTNVVIEVGNSCLVPEGDNEEFKVGTSPEGEDTLQEILEADFSVDVEEDQYSYEVWNFASEDTDSVTFNVTVLAKEAGNTQEFGYYKAGDSSTFVSLFTIPPTGEDTVVPVTVPASFANSIAFAIKTSNGEETNMWHSESALNDADDDHNHVAVYNPYENSYILAFEDIAIQDSSDEDYNDLVVKIDRVLCHEDEEEEEVCGVEENLIANGSFEYPVVTEESDWERFLESDGVQWVITKVSDAVATTLEFHRWWSSNEAADGEQYVELDGDQPTQVAQAVDTEAGATYKLSWAFAPRQDTADVENNLGVLVEGVQQATEGPTAGIGTLDSEDWVYGDYEFVAGDASTDIAFKDLGSESKEEGNDVGTFLDDVRLCKVKDAPEVVDVCPNLEGNQSTVPEGYTLNNNECVTDSNTSSGGGGHRNRNNNDDEPEGDVEGASDSQEDATQVTAIPLVAGVNTGAGGAGSAPYQAVPMLALLAMAASAVVIRRTSNAL